MSVLHSDVEISYIYIYMKLFEQNCNFDNPKMAALDRNM